MIGNVVYHMLVGYIRNTNPLYFLNQVGHTIEPGNDNNEGCHVQWFYPVRLLENRHGIS